MVLLYNHPAKSEIRKSWGELIVMKRPEVVKSMLNVGVRAYLGQEIRKMFFDSSAISFAKNIHLVIDQKGRGRIEIVFYPQENWVDLWDSEELCIDVGDWSLSEIGSLIENVLSVVKFIFGDVPSLLVSKEEV